MVARIRTYIERAFADAPKSKKSTELQEELISNMIEKYNDQLKLGKTEEEAYTAVIAGLGDIGELVDGLRDRQVLSQPSAEERKKSALLIAVAVGLFILSPVLLIVFAVMAQPIVGVSLMLVMIAIGTGLLIYNAESKPAYVKEEETLVEEFKEWKTGRSREKSITDSFFAGFSLIVVAIYLLVSFRYGIWAYSWIIFIIAAAIRNIAMAVIRMREGKK
ncbi:MAG TPA: permease prefix domain 1-containing protein [Clostridia bacterium]